LKEFIFPKAFPLLEDLPLWDIPNAVEESQLRWLQLHKVGISELIILQQ
jgi:hypothetical protein